VKFDYRDVPTVIADEESGPRQALQGHLKSLGFQNINHVESVEALANRLEKSEVALLIGSATMGDGQVLELVRQIRRNEIAAQPFMPVVALVDEPEAMLVRRVIDSGADLIFTHPVSQTSVEQGLKILVMRRKPFVVTYDYVDPDRRRESRDDGSGAPLVEVPNPLRRWATGFSDEPPSKRF
jgi:DNA-binding NarL/FixJ family response regulator